jgi:hypothetical protein
MVLQMKQQCPECRQPLKTARSCLCGWRSNFVSAPVKQDLRCAYTIGARRCPLIGEVSPTTRGESSWYCGGHWRALNNPKRGEEVLRDAEKNYLQIIESQKSWRDKLWEK